MRTVRKRLLKKSGFTLVEVLIALSLLGLLTVMLFTSFNAVVRAWETGRSTIDAAGHADYLMEQLSAALRSAYYPGSGEKYGLVFVNDGEDQSARDIIEWTKIGAALVGEDAEFAQVPHRVRISVTEPDGAFPGGFTVRAWRQDLQLEEFDPEVDTAELSLSPEVIGLNCRMLDPNTTKTVDGELNWVDEWTKTNTLPTVLEITFWMRSPEKDGEPIASQRIIELPMGALSQNPSLAGAANSEARTGTSTSVGGRRRRSNRSINDSSGGVFKPGKGRPSQSSSNRPGGNSSGGMFRPEAASSSGERPPPPPSM